MTRGAARRVVRALVALPRAIVAAVRSPTRRAFLALPLALAANLAALVLVFALARAVYYPFWASGASREALDRSWGGPSAIGATLVHWLVAFATMAVMYLVIAITVDRSEGLARDGVARRRQ
jgi:hypothetical protein